MLIVCVQCSLHICMHVVVHVCIFNTW
jgi:hypothetical protein